MQVGMLWLWACRDAPEVSCTVLRAELGRETLSRLGGVKGLENPQKKGCVLSATSPDAVPALLGGTGA